MGDTRNEFSGDNAQFVVQGRDFSGPITYAPVVGDDPLDKAARALGQAVYAQWRDEAGMRGLIDPVPIPVSWTALRAPAADHPTNVGGEISGNSGDLAQVALAFRRLRRQRLVVVGEPGSGKTSLAVLLVLELLDTAPPGAPVPVLFSLESWDPEREHLRKWLARLIEGEYPDIPGAVALKLLAAGRVLPVLDGLDELAAPDRAAALRQLNRAISAGDPLVLTCRSAEYDAAVRDVGTAITSAAVVMAEPLSLTTILGYLRRTTPPGAATRWQLLLDHLERLPTGQAALALRTPLMVSLLRAVYAMPGADPAELLDTQRFPGRVAVENHLLDSLIPVAFGERPPEPYRSASRQWPAPKAIRWLTFLAAHLDRIQSQDIAWWRLSQVETRKWHYLWSGLIAGLLWLISVRVAAHLVSAPATSPVNEFSGYGAFIVAALFAVVTRPLFSAHERRKKSPKREQIMGPWAPLTVVLICTGFSVVTWLAMWLLLLLPLILGKGFEQDPLANPPPAIVLSEPWRSQLGMLPTFLMIAPAYILLQYSALAAGPDLTKTRRVTTNLARARRAAFITTTVTAGIFVPTLILGALIAYPKGLATAVYALAALAFALFIHCRSSWGGYARAHRLLALSGAVPWRLMTFLEDARRLGVLRQEGAVYQFRHARLRDRLVQRPQN